MEKITAYLRNIYEKMSQQPPAEVKPVKVPLFGMMFAPYLPIIDNFGKFVRIILFYSIFNGIISLLLGQGYMCSYTGFTGHCSSDIYIYGFSWLFNAAVAIVFAIRWYAYCFEKQEISWKFLFCVGPKDLKFSAMIMIVSNILGKLPVFSYIGRYSIVVLGFHTFLIRPLKFVFSFFPMPLPCLYVAIFVCVVLLMRFLVIPLSLRLFPCFVAQKDLISCKSGNLPPGS